MIKHKWLKIAGGVAILLGFCYWHALRTIKLEELKDVELARRMFKSGFIQGAAIVCQNNSIQFSKTALGATADIMWVVIISQYEKIKP